MNKKEYRIILDLEKEGELQAYRNIENFKNKGYLHKKDFIVKSINENENKEKFLEIIEDIVRRSVRRSIKDVLDKGSYFSFD